MCRNTAPTQRLNHIILGAITRCCPSTGRIRQHSLQGVVIRDVPTPNNNVDIQYFKVLALGVGHGSEKSKMRCFLSPEGPPRAWELGRLNKPVCGPGEMNPDLVVSAHLVTFTLSRRWARRVAKACTRELMVGQPLFTFIVTVFTFCRQREQSTFFQVFLPWPSSCLGQGLATAKP